MKAAINQGALMARAFANSRIETEWTVITEGVAFTEFPWEGWWTREIPLPEGAVE